MREDEAIHGMLVDAICDQRLLPGTRLVELELAASLSTTRRHVERALIRLAHDGLVLLRPNRGACIAAPSTQQALDLFTLRRIVETGLVRALAAITTATRLAPLRRNLDAEHAARREGRSREAVRLSGAFHVLLAQAAAEAPGAALMQKLIAQTALVTRLYGNERGLDCWHDEHDGLLDALQNRDASTACARMEAHLEHLRQDLRIDPILRRRRLRIILAVEATAGSALRRGGQG